MNSIKKIVVVFAVAILMLSFGLATAFATSDLKNEKKNNGLAIESKEKRVSTYNIKWDANGGKIGTKKTVKTSVKKGSKINKLVSTPKRTGYSFKGWYSKKSGGSKITTNTKPKKSTTYWAQWTKKRVLNAEEKKLLGRYSTGAYSSGYWSYNNYNTDKWTSASGYGVGREFQSDGTYQGYGFAFGYSVGNGYYFDTAKWHISPKGTLHITNLMRDSYDGYGNYKGTQKMLDSSYKYTYTEKYGKTGIELTYKSFSPDFYEKR